MLHRSDKIVIINSIESACLSLNMCACMYIYIYLDPPRGAKWMVKGAIKQPLRVQTPPLGGCWYIYIYLF